MSVSQNAVYAIVAVIRMLLTCTVMSAVFVHPNLSAWITIESAVHQGCVLAPDSSAMGMD